MRQVLRYATAALSLLALSMLAACGSGFTRADINNQTKFSSAAYGVGASPRVTTSAHIPRGGGRYQVGQPYRVAGRWFHPSEQPDYDETGMASWYGPNFHGRLTANGEIFDQNFLSAAHPTLPLPSYVQVENLENGRSVIVRVNDRGPFAAGRIIDLSRAAADALGYLNQGTAQVRVTYVGPAPVEGDDTNYLVASISGPGARMPTVAPVPGVTGRGVLNSVFSLFSYAPEETVEPNEALSAATQLGEFAPSDLPADGGMSVDMPIGQFTSAEIAARVATHFAAFGAVDFDWVDANGQREISLRLVHLKAGVLPSDIEATKAILGL